MLRSKGKTSMRRIPILFVILLICLLSSRAEALTFSDVIELTRAGLGEEVLLALIEVDRSVFPIDAASIKRLKEAGVNERVIMAMIRSGREVPTAQDQTPVDPQPVPVAPPVVVIEHQEPPVVREVPVAVPVFVPVPVATRSSHSVSVHRGDQLYGATELSFGQTVPTTHGASVKRPEPVYWGWGGKLRPDAWDQPAQTTTDRKK